MLLPTATREGHAAVTSGLRVQVAVGPAAPGGSAARKSCVSLGRRLSWTLRAPLAEPRSLLPLPHPSHRQGHRSRSAPASPRSSGPGAPAGAGVPAALSSRPSTAVFGAASPLSPSHPLTTPRPLPPAPPPGRSSRLSCRRLLKLHVFHFSDVFDCTAVFFCFCVCVSWTLSPSGQRLCLILGRVPGAQLDGRPRGPCHACAERMTRRPTGQALRVSPASAFTQLPSVPYPGIGHRAAERRWGPRARVLRCAPRPPPPLFHPCPSDFPLRGPS